MVLGYVQLRNWDFGRTDVDTSTITITSAIQKSGYGSTTCTTMATGTFLLSNRN